MRLELLPPTNTQPARNQREKTPHNSINGSSSCFRLANRISGQLASIGAIGGAEGWRDCVGIVDQRTRAKSVQKTRAMRLAWLPRFNQPHGSRKGGNNSYLSNNGLTSSVDWRNRFSRQCGVDRHHRQRRRAPGLRQNRRSNACPPGPDSASGSRESRSYLSPGPRKNS